MIIIIFLLNISFGRVKEMSQGDISLTHPEHMLLYRQLLKYIMNRSFSPNPVCPKKIFRIREYLEKLKFEFSRFYCITFHPFKLALLQETLETFL